jgi:hypothetical protein
MLSMKPAFGGEITGRPIPDEFFARMDARIRDGLFVRGERRRADYRVRSFDRESLAFEAQGPLTAWSIGLNDVQLRRTGPTTLSYRVEYRRWNLFCVILGATIGAALAAAYALWPAVRHDVAAYPYGPFWFWTLILFWAGGWPWLLTAAHRPFARRALVDILNEELSRGTPARSAA